jgi:hypothetical protein
VTQESVLQLIEDRRASRESLDGCYLMALDLRCGHKARTNWVAVKQNSTGAAVTGVATDFRSGQAQVFSEHAREPSIGRS